MFIVPYPIGQAPSQRFRFEQYFQILKEHDIQFDVSSFWSQRGWIILYSKGNFFEKMLFLLLGFLKRFFLLFRIHKYQVIFLHREAIPLGPPIFEFIIAKLFRKKIIYDFDDAIWLQNTSDQNSMIGKLKYHRKVGLICKWSWKVSCGNEFLAQFAKNFNDNIVVNPTTIDTSYHKSTKETQSNQTVTIGWTGTHSTIKYLDPILPILQHLNEEFDINIMIIANQKPTWDFDAYEFIKWDKEREIEQLDMIDIGIMPLNETIWEKGKCGFKALQYMALGKPTVASNVGANEDILDHEKTGFLCANIEDWQKYLAQLITSTSLRTSLGGNGRKKVLESYSVQSNTGLFLSLFE